MLKYLRVENFAIVRETDISFGTGLTIMTGETGTGKSIIIDALGLVLGDRANLSMIRKDEEKAVVEAVFNTPDNPDAVKSLLQSEDLLLEEGELTIRREIHKNGKSRAFLNDQYISVQTLKALADHLVEMHGQHEHQKILNPSSHIEYLDALTKTPELIQDYEKSYLELKKAVQNKKELQANRDQFLKDRELKQFHYNELKKINPAPHELDNLEAELKILENSQMLVDISHRIAAELYENDQSIVAVISMLRNQLDHLVRIDPNLSVYSTELESAILTLEETGRSMAEYRDHIPHDTVRLNELEDRVNTLNFLLKKYHRNYEELCGYFEQLKQELGNSTDYSQELEKADKAVETARTKLIESGEILHIKRKESSKAFTEAVESRLKKLGMEHAKFRVRFSVSEGNSPLSVLWNDQYILPQSNGFDLIEFDIITNPGEDFRPLTQTASGGEASRIMLGIKSVLSDADSIPTLIFDEADTGVSGRIARIVGEQIEELSKYHQVICITHLPQIASLGNQHVMVEKWVTGGRTEAGIRPLNHEERVHEIAKLLGAGHLTDATLENAKDLLNKTQKSGFGT